MLRVGINGDGTIRTRVGQAVRGQPDMTVAGVSKQSPTQHAVIAHESGDPLTVPDGEPAAAFAGTDPPPRAATSSRGGQ